jgi:hypothetical protein
MNMAAKSLMAFSSRFLSFILDGASDDKNRYPDGVVSAGQHKNERQPDTKKTSRRKTHQTRNNSIQQGHSERDKRIPDTYSPR